jgi:ACS family hexuronate transporter-like MFS transporter
LERLSAEADDSENAAAASERSAPIRSAELGPMPAQSTRATWLPWYVCGLLLLATTINYMDRQTLSSAASRVIDDFQITKEQYGELELWFGLSFAAGALVFGLLADLTSVWLLYPAVLVAWSLTGIATGRVTTFGGLATCRALLGLFEAGHWPCALKTTQRLLSSGQRTLGNSILQSGTSIGAIVTPLVMRSMLTPEAGSWRFPFQIIGAVGLAWAVLWLGTIRRAEVSGPVEPSPGVKARQSAAGTTRTTGELVRRFGVLVIVVITINICWHLFRVWLPLFLQQGRGYSESDALAFTSVFYVATDVGCIAAGAASIGLQRWGAKAGFARWLVFAGCSAITALSVVVAYTPQGYLLLGLLLVVGAGALGLFPCYYALSQELSANHQGKVTGILGAIAWVSIAPIHKYFGRLVDETGSYDLGIAIVGCLPLVALVAWGLLWDWSNEPATR